jgi:hypothetical protein
MRAERKDEDGERYVSAMTQGRAVSRILRGRPGWIWDFGLGRHT